MFRRISRLSLLCALAILVLCSTSEASSRYPRYASCSSCGQDSPGALSSPWYGASEEEYPRRDFRGVERESSPFRARQEYRGPAVFPSFHEHRQESSPREHENYGIRKSADFNHRHSNTYPVTPAPAPAPRPGFPLSSGVSRYPNRYPFEPIRRPASQEHRPRDFTRRPQFPERNYPSIRSRERGPETSNYFVHRDRIPQESSLGLRRGDREEQDFPERTQEVTLVSEASKRSRGEQVSLEPRSRVQYRPEPEDSEEEELVEEGPDSKGRRYRIGTVIRPGSSRPVARQVQDQPKEQPRKDRSREAEILRVTQITIDPEATYAEDAQPDMSVLRFTPENARGARPYMGGPVWEEEEFVDIRKETPFGASETISMDKESFGPDGFEEERFTEEFDSFGWRRQAQEGSTPGLVVIQSREAPKDEADLSAEDIPESKVDEAVMKIAPRQPKDKNSGQKDFDGPTNPDFYGDIVYPPTDESANADLPRAKDEAENTTTAPKKAE